MKSTSSMVDEEKSKTKTWDSPYIQPTDGNTSP
jgi:hypothetical protein